MAAANLHVAATPMGSSENELESSISGETWEQPKQQESGPARHPREYECIVIIETLLAPRTLCRSRTYGASMVFLTAKVKLIHDATPTRVSSSWHHIYSGIDEFDID
jgi:hypothetical protein